jgi:hypothetical protein
MKYFYLLITTVFLLSACEQQLSTSGTSASDASALLTAINEAEPGSVITMANGTYKDLQIELYGEGTEDKPITLRAETAGEVFIEGQSSLHLGGSYLIVDGLHFRDGKRLVESSMCTCTIMSLPITRSDMWLYYGALRIISTVTTLKPNQVESKLSSNKSLSCYTK